MVLGGETLCSTPRTKVTTVGPMVPFVTTPDEADMGALGDTVDKTGDTT